MDVETGVGIEASIVESGWAWSSVGGLVTIVGSDGSEGPIRPATRFERVAGEEVSPVAVGSRSWVGTPAHSMS